MKHSYACKVLKDKKMKIFAKGQNILNQGYVKIYPKKIKTIISKNTDFVRSLLTNEGIREIIDYQELTSLGFKIIKYKPETSMYDYQKFAYSIVKHNWNRVEGTEVSRMPAGHYVLYDVINQSLQGIGRGFGFTGRSEWIPMKEHHEFPKTVNKENICNKKYDKTNTSFSERFYGFRKQEFFSIPEGVIGVTDDGYIACIPKPTKTDPQFRIIFGGKGNGKSLLSNNLEDIDINKFDHYACNINDVKAESKTRCEEWDKGAFKTELERFGEQSIPKPCVFLHPTTTDEYVKIHYKEVGFDISIPLKELLKDEQLITYNKSWKMKEETAGAAYRNLIKREGKYRSEGLLNAKSLSEALNIIDREVENQGIREKLQRVISDIFNTNMVDISSGIPSKWVLAQGSKADADYAWNICMKAGLIPYIITKGIRGELWFALLLRFVIESIMQFADNQEEKPVNIFIDEIEELLKNAVTRDIIERAIRECRGKHVGVTIVVHNYEYMKAIYTHSTGYSSYKFVFNTAEPQLILKLKGEGLTASQAKDIPNLKQFQCYAIGDFVLYDLDGNKVKQKNKIIKIVRIKPPNCKHYAG